ncbi:MAG: hypothetical protein MR935_06675 [Agathobaculum sp.]|nr:hypothetical protein [Agathobaculum sp.]
MAGFLLKQQKSFTIVPLYRRKSRKTFFRHTGQGGRHAPPDVWEQENGLLAVFAAVSARRTGEK